MNVLCFFRVNAVRFTVSQRRDIFIFFEEFRKPADRRKAYGITDFFDGVFGVGKIFFGFLYANLR